MTELQKVRRLANEGSEYEIRPGEVLVIKEPSLRTLLKFAEDVSEVAEKYQNLANEGDEPSAILLKLLQEDASFNILCSLAAEFCNADKSLFEELPVSGWLKFASSVKEEVDFEELHQLFMQILPKAIPKETQSEA